MPNPNYVKGVKKERAIVNQARAEGKIAFRSAGSHSPVDVVIIDYFSKTIKLIQCKPDNFSHKKVIALETRYASIDGIYKVIFEVR